MIPGRGGGKLLYKTLIKFVYKQTEPVFYSSYTIMSTTNICLP